MKTSSPWLTFYPPAIQYPSAFPRAKPVSSLFGTSPAWMNAWPPSTQEPSEKWHPEWKTDACSIEQAEKYHARHWPMAITAFVGVPGSGKTYEAVHHILSNLRKGRHVYTNIEGIDSPQCRKNISIYCGISDLAVMIHLHHMGETDTLEFWKHIPDGSLVVLDEIHKLFSNREWNTQKNKEFANWCSTHRHLGCEVVLITQAIDKVDSHVQSLIEWSYVYRKVNFLGSAVKHKYMKYVYYSDDVRGAPMKKHLATYDTGVFPCYQSYVAKDIKEKGFMAHANILKHPVFFAIPLVLGFAIYMLFGKSSLATGDVFGTQAAQKSMEAKLKKKSPVPGTIVRPGQPAPAPGQPLPAVLSPDELLQARMTAGEIMVAYTSPAGGTTWTNIVQPGLVPARILSLRPGLSTAANPSVPTDPAGVSGVSPVPLPGLLAAVPPSPPTTARP